MKRSRNGKRRRDASRARTNCSVCGATITSSSKTGRCQPCAARKTGRIYGLINGRKNVESGQLARIRELPQAKAAQRKNGRIYGHINGRKNVESGQLARIRELPQTKAAQREAGRKSAESGHLDRIRELPQAKAAQREAGRIVGRKNVESGQLDRIRELPQAKAAQRKNGRIVGRKNVESGQLDRIHELPQAKAAQREVGRKSAESGHLDRIRELPQTKAAQREAGRKAAESGQLFWNSRGVKSTIDNVLFQSQTEAIFWCVAKELGGRPLRPKKAVKLPDGRSYLPDFLLQVPVLGLPAGVPIELKSSRKTFPRFLKNVEKAKKTGAKVVYADELWSLGTERAFDTDDALASLSQGGKISRKTAK